MRIVVHKLFGVRLVKIPLYCYNTNAINITKNHIQDSEANTLK